MVGSDRLRCESRCTSLTRTKKTIIMAYDDFSVPVRQFLLLCGICFSFFDGSLFDLGFHVVFLIMERDCQCFMVSTFAVRTDTRTLQAPCRH